MDSLATVLRRIPLFADLPPGSFAKIIADLREEHYPPGTVICHEGDEARDFYIIKSGEVEVLVNRGWNQRELIAVSGPNEWFGERALFSDRPRSATVIARTEVELWRLTKEKFDGLIEENPRLILHFTQVISDRLYQANQELSKKQAAFNLQIEALFQAQPPAQQELLTRTAILSALGLTLSGTAITTFIPDSTSATAIAGPIILALSDSLGYTRRSKGSAGLAMAALLGFGQMGPFFLTGAAENLLAWGLLPAAARAQITWGSWALAALPLAVVTLGVAFTLTMLTFPPEFQPTISRGLIETQIEALGPPSRAELVNGAVLLAAMAGWISAPYHLIDVAWVAMSGLALLLATNLLDRVTFRSGINWDFLFYLGAVLSLTSVVQQLDIDTWVIQQVAPLLEPMVAHPALFLLVMALAVFAARFILPSFPLVSLLTITVVPVTASAGINPLALVLVICMTVTVWFLPYQSTCYLALYFGTKEKAFSHAQVRPLAWSYGVIYLLAILVAIPYWWLLGLLP